MPVLKKSIAMLVSSVLVLTTLVSPHANAESLEKKLNAVLLGDSYSAGNGAGSYEFGEEGEGKSYRSTINWARNYISWLNAQGVNASLNNVAASGSVTFDLLKKDGQIEKGVQPDTDLVMLTIGGNDVDFGAIVVECFTTPMRDAKGCKKAVDNANNKLSGTISNTEEVLKRISEKLQPGAEIVLVGYPLLSTDRKYKLVNCYKYERGAPSELSIVPSLKCTDRFEYDAGTEVRKLGNAATKAQSELVNEWNKNESIKVTYIDSIETAFSGHEPDPSVDSKNSKRWVNEFFETEGRLQEDGNTKGKYSGDKNNWYHPNVIGHQKIAAEIQRQVGVPSSTKPVGSTSGDIDVVFAIDATGSMSYAIDSVKDDVRAIANDIQAKSNSYRFGLVTYKDHPVTGGDYGDYPSKLELGFTTDISAFESALSDIQVSGGGDDAESVYSGIMEGLKLDWRPGVKKVVLAIGDAPPKDPEPITGYTAQSVAKVAFDIDPVEVYAIDNGRMTTGSMQTLVDLSAGQTFRTASGGDVPQLITDAVTTALDKPFGWLQGPISGYVGVPVELDARGSYAFDGPITQYEWDFDGDGSYELSTSEGLIEHTYSAPFNGVAGVRVTALDGQYAVGSAPVNVDFEPEAEPEVQPAPDQEGVYEVLDGGPLPFEIASDEESDDPTSSNSLSSINSSEIDGPLRVLFAVGGIAALLGGVFGFLINSGIISPELIPAPTRQAFGI